MQKRRFAQKMNIMLKNQSLCEVCWVVSARTLHHKDEDQSNNRGDNLLPVCRECHLNIPHKVDELNRNATQTHSNAPTTRVTVDKTEYMTPKNCNTQIIGVKTLHKDNIFIYLEGSSRVSNLLKGWGYESI